MTKTYGQIYDSPNFFPMGDPRRIMRFPYFKLPDDHTFGRIIPLDRVISVREGYLRFLILFLRCARDPSYETSPIYHQIVTSLQFNKNIIWSILCFLLN